MLRKKSLAFKLSFFILSAVLIIVLLILNYNYQVSKKMILNQAKENARNLAQATVNKIENLLMTTEKIPENIAYILENSSLSGSEQKNLLRMIVANNKEVFGSCIAFEPYTFHPDSFFYAPYYYKQNEKVLSKYLGNKQYNYFELEWYKLPKQSGPMWCEPYFDEGGGNIIMSTFSVPFYAADKGNRRFRGVVTADISLEWLDSLMKTVHIYEKGYAFLISKKGTVISHPKTSMILEQTIFKSAKKYNRPDLAEIGRNMVAGKSGFIPYNSFTLNRKCWLYYSPLPANNWSMGVVFPEKELFAELNQLARLLIILGGAGIICLFILIISISRNITIPLRNLVKATIPIGQGNFNVSLPVLKSKDEIAQLTGSFNLMQQHLKEYLLNLKETTAAKEKFESELKIAHDIQQGIIPKMFPPFPHRDDVDIYAVLYPAKEVGGDLYDFFFIDDDKLILAIGDVSGKGVPASLFMAITMTLLRAKSSQGFRVNEIVGNINDDLCRDNQNSMFVTFFLGMIDLKSGELSYCNAGHNYPYILRKNGTLECLNTTHGTPLGLFEGSAYKSESLILNKSEFLVLYTDGITEAEDTNHNFYGEERLEQLLLNKNRDISVKGIIENLLDDNKGFIKGADQSDDITLLVMTYKNDPADKTFLSEHLVIRNELSELSKLNTAFDSLAGKAEFSKELYFDLKLVLEELISNIINYAFDDKEKHTIKIDMEVHQGTVTITTGDDGKEFNPLNTPPPDDLDKPLEERNVGGLGVFLVKTLVDSMEYQRKDGRNILVVRKRID